MLVSKTVGLCYLTKFATDEISRSPLDRICLSAVKHSIMLLCNLTTCSLLLQKEMGMVSFEIREMVMNFSGRYESVPSCTRVV